MAYRTVETHGLAVTHTGQLESMLSNDRQTYQRAHRFADLWQIPDDQVPQAPDPWDQQVAKRQWEKNMVIWKLRLDAFG